MKYWSVAVSVSAMLATASATMALDPQVLEQRLRQQHDAAWESMPGRSGLRTAMEDIMDSIGQTLDQALDSIARTGGRVIGSILDEEYGRRRGSTRRTGGDSRTALEVMRESQNARRFVKMVERHHEVRRRLEDGRAGRRRMTIFVPTDEALNQLGDLDRFSADFIDKIVEYHVVDDEYPAARILGVHTLPTVLEERDLGRHPQRIRVSVGLTGIHLNHYSRLVATNIESSNAVIHAVDQVLVPPPRQGKLIDQVPGKFSTFSLAMEKTGLADELHDEAQRGGTVFAPTNYAFARLGRAANSFLFSSEGEEYLRTLLQYHVVANETLYSDAYYEPERRSGRNDDRTENEDRRDDREKQRRGRERTRDGDSDNQLRLFEQHDLDAGSELSGGRDGEGRRDRDSSRHDGRDRRNRNRDVRDDGRNDDDRDDDSRNNSRDDESDGVRPRRQDGKHSRQDENNRAREGRRLDDEKFPRNHWRIELPTLIRSRTLRVDMNRWMGLVSMIVNGQVRVAVQDGMARDGVVHVVESVLMPPRRGGAAGHDEDEDRAGEGEYFDGGEISVDELRMRLRNFIQDNNDDERESRRSNDL